MEFANGQRVVTRNGYHRVYIGKDPNGVQHWILLHNHTSPSLVNGENLFTDDDFIRHNLKPFTDEDLVNEVIRRGAKVPVTAIVID